MAPKPAADGADAAGGLSPGGSYDGGAIPPEEDVRGLVETPRSWTVCSATFSQVILQISGVLLNIILTVVTLA